MTYSRVAASEEISAAASAGGEQNTTTQVTTATEDKAAPASGTRVVGFGPAGSAHDEVKCFAGVEEQLAAYNCAKSTYSLDSLLPASQRP